MLTAGLDDFMAGAERARELIRTVPGPADQALGVLGHAAMRIMEEDRDMMRIMHRDRRHQFHPIDVGAWCGR